MTAVSSDASLRGKVRAFAGKHNLRAQEVLQMYLFEHLLLRLEKSDYSDKFILKGGLLISSMIGLAQRTTMDMDTTVVGMDMGRGSVESAMRGICSTQVGDGMSYEFDRIEPIREDDEYANWRAHIRVRYGRIDAPVKVDITTGDAITPAQVSYRYGLMFDDGSLEIASYPLPTILAEKFETVVRRGITNTRGRDYYDIHALMRAYGGDLDRCQLRQAIDSTARKRGSSELMPGYRGILDEVRDSTVMLKVWSAYIENAPYATGVDFGEAINEAIVLGELFFG